MRFQQELRRPARLTAGHDWECLFQRVLRTFLVLWVLAWPRYSFAVPTEDVQLVYLTLSPGRSSAIVPLRLIKTKHLFDCIRAEWWNIGSAK